MAAFMSPAGGGGDPIQEAMARRGLSGGVTQQVSPGSAGFDPAMQQQLAQTQAGGMPPQTGAPQGATAPQGQPGQPQGNPESKIIIGALKNRLELLGKMGQ